MRRRKKSLVNERLLNPRTRRGEMEQELARRAKLRTRRVREVCVGSDSSPGSTPPPEGFESRQNMG